MSIKDFNYKRLTIYFSLVVILVVINIFVGSAALNTKFPISSNITIFLIININVLLLLGVVVLIFRQLGRIFVDRRKKVFGARFKTKLLVFSVIIVVFPVLIVYIFSSALLNNSIDKWFDTQIEQSLKSSINLMQKYQTRLEKDILEQSNILAQLISSKGFVFIDKQKELDKFIDKYIEDNRIDGIAVYNHQKVKLSSRERSSLFFLSFLNDEIVGETLQKKQIARYESFGFDQVYWVGVPISSKRNDKLVVGALFIYNKVPMNEAEKVSKIYDSYKNYSQIKFYADPVSNSYKVLLILMTLIAMLVAIWGSLVFARSVTVPIENLASASLEVAKGNLNVKVDEGGNDEIGVLTTSFNSMVAKLDEHNSELNLKNRKLSEMYMQIAKDNQYIDTIFKHVKSAIFLYDNDLEILKNNSLAENLIKENWGEYQDNILSPLYNFMKSTEIKVDFQTEMVIDDEKKILSVNMIKLYGHEEEEANVVMVIDDITEIMHYQRISIWKEIATRIAHEIKNPLTPIKLTAERLKKRVGKLEKSKDNEVFEGGMDTIINEVNELQKLLNEFNMYARLPQLTKEDFSLCEFFGEISSLYKQSNPEINITVVCRGINIVGDRRQLRRVFINLIDNSIHAMGKNGDISISAVENDGEVRIYYEDNGEGIPKEDLSNIFVPYFSKKPDGTGLGLAIVKKIIDEHDGDIEVTSEYGKFTRFTIRFIKGAA